MHPSSAPSRVQCDNVNQHSYLRDDASESLRQPAKHSGGRNSSEPGAADVYVSAKARELRRGTQPSTSEHRGSQEPSRAHTFSGAATYSMSSRPPSLRSCKWAPISPLVPPPPPFVGVPVSHAKALGKPGVAILPKPPPQDGVHMHLQGLAKVVPGSETTFSVPSCARASQPSRFESQKQLLRPVSPPTSATTGPQHRPLYRSANGAPPSPPQPSPLSTPASPGASTSFNRCSSMPPIRYMEPSRADTASSSPQPLSPVGSVGPSRAWANYVHSNLLPPLEWAQPCPSPLSGRPSTSSSTCSSSTLRSVGSSQWPVTPRAAGQGSFAAPLARLVVCCLFILFYSAILLADVDAWRERRLRHSVALAQRRRLYSMHGDEQLYGDTDTVVGGGNFLWPSIVTLRALLAVVMPGVGGGASDGGPPMFPWFHAVVALPCLVALLLGRASETAALLLAGRLLATLVCYHSWGLLLFWRGERVQLLRLKELAAVGATLLAASRAGPVAASLLAGADAGAAVAAGSPELMDDVLASPGPGKAWSRQAAAARRRGARPQASDQRSVGRGSSTASPGAPPAERSHPPSPVVQQLHAQLLQVQQRQLAQQRRMLAKRAFWAFQRLLRRLGLVVMLPLFGYYGLLQVEELRDMVESGSGARAAVVELMTETYRWVPRGDGAAETYWLPAQLATALPFFLGVGPGWSAAALAAAVGLEGVLCWRFWARSSMMWSYILLVTRHFLANAVIAAGLLSTLSGPDVRRKDGTLPVGSKDSG